MAKSGKQKIELIGADLIQKAIKRLQEDLEQTARGLFLGYAYGKPSVPDLKDLSSGDTLFGLFSRDLRENLLTDIAATYGNIPIDIVISDDDLQSKHVIDVRILNDESQEVLRITIPTATFISESFNSKRRYLAIAERVIPAIAQLLEKEDDEEEG